MRGQVRLEHHSMLQPHLFAHFLTCFQLAVTTVRSLAHVQVRTNGSDAEPYYLMGQPKSFIFDLGEGYPTYTLYSDCHGHGVSPPLLPVMSLESRSGAIRSETATGLMCAKVAGQSIVIRLPDEIGASRTGSTS